MASVLEDLLPALLAATVAAIFPPAGVAAFAAFQSAFVVTAVLTAASKLLAKNAPSIDTSLLSRTQSLRTPIGSRQIIYGQVRVGGQITFAKQVNFVTDRFGVTTITVNTLNLVITLSGHEVQEIGDVWFDAQVVALTGSGSNGGGDGTGKYAGKATIEKRLGTATDEVISGMEIVAGVASTFRQYGCAKVYVRLAKDNDVYPNGIPNITAVVKGAKVYDPRTGLTAYSNNAALCVNHYLCLPKKDGGMGVDYATEISEAALTAAANICDQDVTLAAGGTEKRYTLNGAFLTSVEPKSIIESMLSAMAGSCVCIGGVWHINAGAYATPTVTLDEGDARGPIRTQTRVSRAEIFNGVKGVYISPANNWQPTDYTPAVNATFLAEDGDERLWKPGNADFQFTTSHATAQRLAKIELERARQQITEFFPANLAGLQVQPGDTVYRNSTAKGWSSKVFEVVESKFVVYSDDAGAPALGVDLTLRETASTVWDWNSGEETQVDDAPDSELANPFSPTVPGIVSVTETLYQTTGSAGVKSRAVVTLGVLDDGSNADYQVQYKLHSTSTWTVLPVSKDVTIDVFDQAAGVYDFRARAFNNLGVASDYSDTWTQELYGLTAPPADITGFSVRAMAGMAWAMLDRHTDLDVIQGGRIILRWSPDSAADWNDATLLSQEGWPGDSEQIIAPLLAGTYLAKARDSTGNLSDNAASFEITDASLTGYITLDTVTENAAFAGAKTSLIVSGGGLQLSGSSFVDDIASVDAVADWDAEGGTAMAGEYLFASEIDVGSSQTVRLFPHQRGSNFDVGDNWDDRPLTIDNWADVDGADVDDVDSTLYVRITTSNPAPGSPGAAPTWGPWHVLMGPADYTLWGAQFKLVFVSADQAHNRNVDELSVAAKQAA